jgi:hypothetical protein
MIGSLFEAAGEDNVRITPAITGAEAFSFFAKSFKALYLFCSLLP